MNKIKTENFEDKIREEKTNVSSKNIYSKYRDLIFYHPSTNPELTIAMIVNKPAQPGYILAETHGWHMSIPKYVPNDDAPISDYIFISVDMRGRAYSEGKQDCNGYELYDVIDAIEYVKEHYKEYIIDPEVVYFECGSGGGGNAFEIVNKFPDYFAACTSMCGISDYYVWFVNDKVGEFKDEMVVWIGDIANRTAYKSRSGIDGLQNLITPMFIAHGRCDERVPFYQSQNYVDEANRIGKGNLITFLPFDGVGGFEHWQNITDEQMALMNKMSEENRVRNRKPIELPRKGQLVVQGYIVTKYFKYTLKSIDDVAILDYDVDKNEYKLTYIE